MFLLFGFRRRGQRLGVLMWPCSRCGVATAHTLTYIRTWFTLFFIPVIPFPTRRKLVCTNCGNADKFDKTQRQSIEEAARAGAARAAAIAQAAAQVPGGPMAPPYPVAYPPAAPGAPLQGADSPAPAAWPQPYPPADPAVGAPPPPPWAQTSAPLAPPPAPEQ